MKTKKQNGFKGKYVVLLTIMITSQVYAQNEVLTLINNGASWITLPDRSDGLGSNVNLSLNGSELTISDGVNSSTEDLIGAAIADGTGTDDQTIDAFSLSSTTLLNLSLEGDGVANYQVDIEEAVDSLIYHISVNVDFPNINDGSELDLTTTTVIPSNINEFPMMFGMPLNILNHNLKFTAYRDTNNNLHIICANYAGAALDLPPFDLNITVLRGSY